MKEAWDEGFKAALKWHHDVEQFWKANDYGSSPVEPENPYESQRQWVGLDDAEIEMIVENRRAAHWEFVRQVEAKLKEKNT